MSRLGTLAHSLYSGEVSYDFVGQRRRWYACLRRSSCSR